MAIRNLKTIVFLLIVLLSLNFILALGLSSPYWKDNPLKVAPGQTKEIAFTLVSSPGSDTEKAFVTLDNNGGIAKLKSGDEYTVKPNSRDTKVILEITIPEEAPIGQEYQIHLSVKSEPLSEKGMAQIVIGYSADLPVVVVPEEELPEEKGVVELEEPKSTGYMFWLVGVLIIIIIAAALIWLIRKNKA